MSQPATGPTPPPELPEPGPGQLGVTTPKQAVVAALSGAVAGYFVVGTIRWRGGVVPLTPWSIPAVLGALAIAALVYSRVLRRQVADARGSIAPETGVRALVLGKTLLLAGAILGGGHAVYVGSYLGQWGAPMPHARVVHGGVTILASLAFAFAGWVLERACVVPPGDDLPGPGAGDEV